MSDGSARTVRVGVDGKLSTLSFDASSLTVTREEGNRKVVQVPLRQVLWAHVLGDTIEVHVLAGKKKGAPLSLVNINSKVQGSEQENAAKWVEELLDGAYRGVKRCKKLKVLINPAGGPGKARPIFIKKVEPILRAARCELDITYTTHHKHGQELAKALPLSFDAVVCLSGDGMMHEVFSGFAEHAFPVRAFQIPVAPIPTGSGNGTSLNLLGLEEGFDIATATLNAVKGTPMKLDLFSLTQGDRRTFSFMSQAIGLMADLDLGTEHLRWMGDGRFIYGFVRDVIKHKPCPVTVSIKVAAQDKHAMVGAFEATRAAQKTAGSLPNGAADIDPSLSDEEAAVLPPLEHDADDRSGWITFDKPLLYLYAGQGPYVGRDLMQFPLSEANDGLIDVVVQEMSSRAVMLKAMDGAEHGAPFWMPTQHYYKAHAYRVTPGPGVKGRLSVDGEVYPFEEFQVEVHRGLATLLSPHGHFAPEFSLKGEGKPAS